MYSLGLLFLFALATAQNPKAELGTQTAVNVAAKLPKLDSKAVTSANQQQQAAGITEICAQALARVARIRLLSRSTDGQKTGRLRRVAPLHCWPVRKEVH